MIAKEGVNGGAESVETKVKSSASWRAPVTQNEVASASHSYRVTRNMFET